jgi:tripartite-type tricarboxylate transporter receptor subunit TctC
MNDLLGGQVDLMCDQTTNTTGRSPPSDQGLRGHLEQAADDAGAEDLPTLDEAGLKGFNVTIWHGLYAPKGTPKAVLDKINAALQGRRSRTRTSSSARRRSAR